MLKYLRQLAGESVVYGISGTIAKFLQFLLVPLYTRVFTPEDYGVLSLITTTMAVIGIFVVLALDNSAARWYWDTENLEDRKRTLASWVWCQLTISSLFALVIVALAEWLAQLIVGRADAAVYFRLTAGLLPLSTLTIVVTNWLRMQRRPWATMYYALGSSLLTILLTFLFVITLDWKLTGVYTAQVLSGLLGSLVALALLRDWIHPRYFNVARLREMLRFALPLIPAALAFWIVNLSDRYFVQYFVSTSEVGLYQFGASIASVVALLTGAFQQAWGPFAMSIHTQSNARQLYAHVLLIYTWLTCAFCTALTLFTPEVVRFIAPDTYASASTVVSFLSFSYVFLGLTYIAAIGLNIVKTNAPTGMAITFAAVLNIVLNLLLIPSMGKVGSALATLLSQMIVPMYIFYQAQRRYPIPYQFGGVVGLFALAFLVIGSATLLPLSMSGVSTVIAKVVLLSLFVPALFVLRIITPAQVVQVVGAGNTMMKFK